MASPLPLELKVSPLQIVFSLVVVVAALILFLGRFLWAMWHAPRGFDATSVVLTIIIGGAIGWWIYGGARRMWLETGLHLRVDEREVRVATRQGKRTMRWEEIYGFTTEDRSTTGESGYWLSLRGRDEQVLAQWDRNWCRFTGGQIRRGDEIESFIRQKLRGLGRLQDEENAATRLWESLHPISDGGGQMVQTNYGWIGWTCIIFFVPCAAVAWNSRTGGPVVASGILAFALLGVYLVSAKATLRVNDELIDTASLYGTFRMHWAEVMRVAIDEQGNTLCFEGTNKRLCFAGPTGWRSAGKGEMLLYISAACERRAIPFDTRSKPIWGGSKNTKIR